MLDYRVKAAKLLVEKKFKDSHFPSVDEPHAFDIFLKNEKDLHEIGLKYLDISNQSFNNSSTTAETTTNDDDNIIQELNNYFSGRDSSCIPPLLSG